MRSRIGREVGAWLSAALLAAAPAGAAELYGAGDLGISWLGVDASAANDLLGLTHEGEDTDETPVYGVALGVEFPLRQALPWQVRMPRWLGGEDVSFPDWSTRFEIEHLRRSDAELDTPGVNPQEPYRASVESWSVMSKLRLDLPVRRPVSWALGRVPFVDPLTVYLGTGIGLAVTDLDVSTGVIFGSKTIEDFTWQAFAGFGYALTERVRWSLGWRYHDLGRLKTTLVDTTGTARGRYAADVAGHEFTTSLSFSFYHLGFLDRE